MDQPIVGLVAVGTNVAFDGWYTRWDDPPQPDAGTGKIESWSRDWYRRADKGGWMSATVVNARPPEGLAAISEPWGAGGSWTFKLVIYGTIPAGQSFGLFLPLPNAGQTRFEFCGHTQGPCVPGKTYSMPFGGMPLLVGTYYYERYTPNGPNTVATDTFATGKSDFATQGSCLVSYTYR